MSHWTGSPIGSPAIFTMPWEGPCDAPGCTRTDNACRFRQAAKPELAGKQVCPNSQCQYWGGNRNEEKEKATRAAKAAARKGPAAAAGVVSPRRHTQAFPAPAGMLPTAHTVPAVPVGGRGAHRGSSDGIERRVSTAGFACTRVEFDDEAAWAAAEDAETVPLAKPTRRICGTIYEIFGRVQHEPRLLEQLIDPQDDRHHEPLDPDEATLKPRYLVDGCFSNLDVPTSAEGLGDRTRRLIRWVTEDTLLNVIKQGHVDEHDPSLLNLLTFDSWISMDRTLEKARAIGLGAWHAALREGAGRAAVGPGGMRRS